MDQRRRLRLLSRASDVEPGADEVTNVFAHSFADADSRRAHDEAAAA